MMDLMELMPREVAETVPDAQVDFLQTWDAAPGEPGRCLITLPKVTFPADC
jgi:hypothetical protein